MFIILLFQVKSMGDDGIIEVCFYKHTEDGWHIYDMYHTVSFDNIVRKIDGPECVLKSRTRWAYKSTDPSVEKCL